MIAKKEKYGNKLNISKEIENFCKYNIDELFSALKKNKMKHNNQSIFEYFIEQAYIDNRILILLMKKILPDTTRQDINAIMAEGKLDNSSAEAVRAKLLSRFSDNIKDVTGERKERD